MSHTASTEQYAKSGTRAPFTSANPLIRRLEEFTSLSDRAREALEGLIDHPVHKVAARRDLIRQGQSPRCVFLIRKGWACRYKILEDGRRQIVDFPIPGDLCDANSFVLSRLDDSIGAVTDLEVVEISHEAFERVTFDEPEVSRALWWQELVSKSYYREWIVNVGARNSIERVAHLLCEMFLRLESVGETDGRSCHWPVTQQDMADATGLTAVHVNRTLKRLRDQELITLAARRLTIPDMGALKQVARFNTDYMHLERLHRHS